MKKIFVFVVLVALFLLPLMSHAEVKFDSREHGLLPTMTINDNVKVTPYGYLYLGGYFESESTGEDTSLNIQPANAGADAPNDVAFHFNATRFGTAFWATYGKIEHNANFQIDFDTAARAPRIRHAYATVETPVVNVLGGQTWSVVGQSDPMIGFELMSNNNDNAWNLGNAYDRLVQFRLWKDIEDGLGTFGAQFGIMQFFNQGDAVIGPTGLTIGDQDIPQFQARLSQTFSLFDQQGLIAGSASLGKVKASNRASFTTALGVFELKIPLKYVILEGEFFYSHGGGYNTGVSQEAIETAAGALSAIKSLGGWAGLKIPFEGIKTTFNALYGIDNPQNAVGGTAVTITKNQLLSGNFYILITDWLSVIPEIEYLVTTYGAGFTEKNIRTTLGGYFYF